MLLNSPWCTICFDRKHVPCFSCACVTPQNHPVLPLLVGPDLTDLRILDNSFSAASVLFLSMSGHLMSVFLARMHGETVPWGQPYLCKQEKPGLGVPLGQAYPSGL